MVNLPHAILFDLDGLLIDSESMYQRAWGIAAGDFGFELTSEFYFQHLSGRNFDDYSNELLDVFGVGFPVLEFKKRCGTLVSNMAQEGGIPVKHGAEHILDWLQGAEIPCGVATGSEHMHAVEWLRLSNLEKYFITIVGRDEVKHGKPNPDLFLSAAERLNVHPEDCLVFEDSDTGVLAATRAGMRTIMVPDRRPPNPESLNTAYSVVGSLSEAQAVLESMSRDELSA